MRRQSLPWMTGCFLAACLAAIAALAAEPDEGWQALAPGMELRLFTAPADPSGGVIAVLRLDPALVDLELGTAMASGRSFTVEGWAELRGFAAAINAGMFRMDDRRLSTGLLRDRTVAVSTFVHPAYGAFFLFQPKSPGLPPVRFVDRDQEPQWRALLEDYHGALQGYRLFGPARRPAWPLAGRRHSQAALGVDGSGRVLWIHCRPRLTMGEFAQALIDLPLDLTGAMYLEGGADAGLFVATPHGPRRFVGDYASDLAATVNDHFWPVPNVLGARPRTGDPRP